MKYPWFFSINIPDCGYQTDHIYEYSEIELLEPLNVMTYCIHSNHDEFILDASIL